MYSKKMKRNVAVFAVLSILAVFPSFAMDAPKPKPKKKSTRQDHNNPKPKKNLTRQDRNWTPQAKVVLNEADAGQAKRQPGDILHTNTHLRGLVEKPKLKTIPFSFESEPVSFESKSVVLEPTRSSLVLKPVSGEAERARAKKQERKAKKLERDLQAREQDKIKADNRMQEIQQELAKIDATELATESPVAKKKEPRTKKQQQPIAPIGCISCPSYVPATPEIPKKKLTRQDRNWTPQAKVVLDKADAGQAKRQPGDIVHTNTHLRRTVEKSGVKTIPFSFESEPVSFESKSVVFEPKTPITKEQ